MQIFAARVTASVFFVAIAFFQGIACSGERIVTDQAGRTVHITASPQRIVALAPSLVEIVFDLGEGHRLVGATIFADFPEEIKNLPRVARTLSWTLKRSCR